jgi:hypothetical protein
MSLVYPDSGQATVIDSGIGLEIQIPAPRNILVMLFLGLWLAGWTFGLVAAYTALMHGIRDAGAVFMLFWLALWIMGGSVALGAFFWMLAGRQIIRLGHDVLSIRWDVYGFGLTRDYDARAISHLRIGSPPFAPLPFPRGAGALGWGGGPLAFDYGSRTIRVGLGIDEAEARQLIPRIQRLLPPPRVP